MSKRKKCSNCEHCDYEPKYKGELPSDAFWCNFWNTYMVIDIFDEINNTCEEYKLKRKQYAIEY